jgi:hypothetical protein
LQSGKKLRLARRGLDSKASHQLAYVAPSRRHGRRGFERRSKFDWLRSGLVDVFGLEDFGGHAFRLRAYEVQGLGGFRTLRRLGAL